jgi:xylitol oxidase
LDALDPLRAKLGEVLQVSEVRLILADDLWLSPANGRDSMAIHFTWRRDRARVDALLPFIEERLRPSTRGRIGASSSTSDRSTRGRPTSPRSWPRAIPAASSAMTS